VVITPEHTVLQVLQLSEERGISGFPVCDGGKVVGIVTSRDLRFETRYDVKVSQIMTPREKLITVNEKDGTSPAEAKALLNKHKLERILVVNDAFELKGLITVKDITKQTTFPNAARDASGRLRVAAAVGVGAGTEERVELLVKAGVDAIVVDTAHGHSKGVIDRVRWVKQNYPRWTSSAAISPPALPPGSGGSRCRRGQGRYRPRLHLHHPYRGRCGRAPDHGHLQRGRRPEGHGRAADR
jgi:IMP dehydrogenase